MNENNYDFKQIEKKWQNYWEENETFKTDVWDFSKPKFYALDMFPYPSGVGLHAGHPEGYTATDIVSRMKRMQGFNVLHPMGWDAFGLPSEQYAIETGNHPSKFTDENIEIFKTQLKSLGFTFDWSKEVSTSDPSYYKWTQWIFKQLFKDNLAKLVDMPVNWCEELGTVLANDEVIDGKSERGGYPVIRKNMKQWVLDIPSYAEVLLNGLDDINWPNSTKEIQRNWIGKSIGSNVIFKIDKHDLDFTVFTTRCDTLFGATYCVLAPELDLVNEITTDEYKTEVETYIKKCASKSDLERTELNKEKTGVFTGAYAINPVNDKKIPIWISDYVLASYGTGCIMAVPAHDERDYDFAKEFDLEIIPVIEGGDITKSAYTGDGLHINSEFLDGLNQVDAINKMLEFLQEKKAGEKCINYRLREWIFARQRYWGEPIPIVHTKDGMVALDDKDLPLVLPELEDYSPSKNGDSPLERATDWVNTTINGEKGKRETSTMPGSAGSSWYFLRYIDPNNDKEIADKKLLEHWLPVDLYVGGPEHAVGHLLYSRFWNNYLYNKGIVPVKEPFQKLVHQGMILGENGLKMGKRYPEYSINPTDIVNEYGADTLRLYEMFMGPLEVDKPWSTNGVRGAKKFIDRVWKLYVTENVISDSDDNSLEKIFNKTVKKVTKDFETCNFNTAISTMMIFVNEVYKNEVFPKTYALDFLKLLNPVIPHVTEELWQKLGNKDSISYSKWPTFDESKIKDEEKEIGVQVNGKLRATIQISIDEDEKTIKEKALNEENVKKHIEGKEIIKTIVIPNKIVNIVVK